MCYTGDEKLCDYTLILYVIYSSENTMTDTPRIADAVENAMYSTSPQPRGKYNQTFDE